MKRRKTLGAKRREVKAAGDLDEFQWAEILRFYGDLCSYCEKRWATHQDHIRPISKGGQHTAANVVPACEPCNRRKGTSRRWLPKRLHPFMLRTDVSGEPIPDSIPQEEIPH